VVFCTVVLVVGYVGLTRLEQARWSGTSRAGRTNATPPLVTPSPPSLPEPSASGPVAEVIQAVAPAAAAAVTGAASSLAGSGAGPLPGGSEGVTVAEARAIGEGAIGEGVPASGMREGAGTEGARGRAARLLAGLRQLGFVAGPLSLEQAGVVEASLKQLKAEGAEAIPAVAEFLAGFEDVSFKPQLVNGCPTLRTALMGVLGEAGGAEASAVLRQALESTADPVEIGVLAERLMKSAPGEEDLDEILGAARDALELARQDKLGGRDVAPLFEVLGRYGDPAVLGGWAGGDGQWGHYVVMALAGMPDGQGIPALLRLAQDAGSAQVARGSFAWQMLAQVASRCVEARAALVREARAGAVPEAVWTQIATGLAGDQYGFGDGGGLEGGAGPAAPPVGLKRYHIYAGNQNFFSRPLSENVSKEDLARRRDLVDELFRATREPAAVAALETARARLGEVTR